MARLTRRGALGALAALAAGMALDPERALWVPGRRTYFDLGGRRAEEELIYGVLRRGEQTYRIVMPGMDAFEFNGVARVLSDGLVQVVPTSRVAVAPEAVTEVTLPHADFYEKGRLKAIELPSLQRVSFDDERLGLLKRMESLTFTVDFGKPRG